MRAPVGLGIGDTLFLTHHASDQLVWFRIKEHTKAGGFKGSMIVHYLVERRPKKPVQKFIPPVDIKAWARVPDSELPPNIRDLFDPG